MNTIASVYVQREDDAAVAIVTAGGIVFHSSFGPSYAFSFVYVLCVVHPVFLKILRVEIRLEKNTQSNETHGSVIMQCSK